MKRKKLTLMLKDESTKGLDMFLADAVKIQVESLYLVGAFTLSKETRIELPVSLDMILTIQEIPGTAFIAPFQSRAEGEAFIAAFEDLLDNMWPVR